MRKTYLDNIRWITVVLVVIYHVFYVYNASGAVGGIGGFSQVQYQDIILYALYPWFMILLFVVSGMSAKYYLNNHTSKEFMKSKNTKLLVPSTIGLFVFWWILGYINMTFGGALDQMSETPGVVKYLIMSVSGIGPLWFIQLLWVFSLLLVLGLKMSGKNSKFRELCSKANVIVLILLTFAVWGASQILNTPVVTVYRFGIYGLGFFLGYIVFSNDEVIDRLEKWWLPLSIAAIGLCVAFVIVFWGQNYSDQSVLGTLLCNAYAWIATLAIFAFMKKWGNFENSFSKFMVKESWGMYIFHYLGVALAAFILAPTSLPAWIKYIITFIAAFVLPIPLYEIISRIPVLRWCILGIKKNKK